MTQITITMLLSQLLARLARKGSALRALNQNGHIVYRLHGPGSRRGRPQAAPFDIDPSVVAEALRRGWLAGSDGIGQVLRLSEAGALALARGVERPPQVTQPSTQPEGSPPPVGLRRSNGESTIARLARSAGPDGRTLIDATEAEAAEHLAIDFHRGRMGPRVTASWDPAARGDRSALAAGPYAPDAGVGITAAQERVRAALAAVGGELANVLLDVCCLDRRLEEVEHARHWPQRSARLVLRIALRALARHYGLTARAPDTPRRSRAWAATDFSPTLDAWFRPQRFARPEAGPPTPPAA